MVNSFVLFDTSLLVLLISEFTLLARSKINRMYEWAVIVTIIVYRITTWIGIALGLKFEQLGASQWRYDHKWLGVTIVLLIMLLWPETKSTKYRTILLGIGTGQILDEISEFLILAGLPIPLSFRDTMADLILIILATIIFLVVRNLIIRNNWRGE